MRIGIDLDEVIGDYIGGFLNWYNGRNGVEIKREDILSYALEENGVFGWTREDKIRYVDEFNERGLLEDIELIEGVREVIERLKEDYELYVVTSRREETRERTERFLNKYFDGVFRDIVFTSEFDDENRKSKADVCVELGLDYMIEDNKDFARECIEKGVKVLLFDRPWNREEIDGVVRVFGWGEVLDRIKNLGRESIVVDDFVYGNEEIKEQVLIDLINSKPIQRLKEIAQYGVPDEYYHKKNYSRYDHSIGVMLLLRKLGADLEEQIAGLLHDVSHTCFSHVVDWAIGDSTKEDYQDNNHLNVIENSEISGILDKYGFDYKKLSDIESFTLLEKEIPDLCADRIDYALRELKKDGFEVEEFVSDLINKEGQIVFKNEEIAEKFAREFLRMQNEHWAGKQARTRYSILGGALKIALDRKIINMEDLYKTDKEIIEILLKSLDEEIIENLNLLKDKLDIVESFEGEGMLLKKKFRYVDPEVLVFGNVKKLSEVSEVFRYLLEKEKENSLIDRRFIYKKVQND